MKLHKIYTSCIRQRGFSLLETIIVMSIVVLLGSCVFVMSTDAMRGYAFRNARGLIVASLVRARSQSMNNICIGESCIDGKAHGVKVTTNNVIIFQGSSFVGRDQNLDEKIEIGVLGSSTISGRDEFVFSHLSGDVGFPGAISLDDDVGHHMYISVNDEGTVD
jgi:prepilin-type N-terminal cleavage/methylation domain-containing protein